MVSTRSHEWSAGAIGQSAAWLAFFLLIAAGWAVLFEMARGDDWICGPATLAQLPMAGFATLWPMWVAMTAAMMLPTILRQMSAYARLPMAGGAGLSGMFGGYLLVWLVGATGFAVVQALVVQSGVLAALGPRWVVWSTAALMLVAGLWQLTRGKELCQTECLSPMAMLMAWFRPGFAGGLAMGMRSGVYCFGCCWAIMAIGLAGGMSSLWWMGAATLFMIMEKLPQFGMRLRRPAGGLLIAGAVAMPLIAG